MPKPLRGIRAGKQTDINRQMKLPQVAPFLSICTYIKADCDLVECGFVYFYSIVVEDINKRQVVNIRFIFLVGASKCLSMSYLYWLAFYFYVILLGIFLISSQVCFRNELNPLLINICLIPKACVFLQVSYSHNIVSYNYENHRNLHPNISFY